jgi:aminoglycoside 2''-phosphotransferase
MHSLGSFPIVKALRDSDVAKILIAIESYNASILTKASNGYARILADHLGIAQTGSSDAHTLHMIGLGATEFPGHTRKDLLTALRDGRIVPQQGEERSAVRILGSWALNDATRVISHPENAASSWRLKWNNLDHSSAAKLLARHLSGTGHSSLETFGSGDFSLAFKLGDQVIRVARHPEAAAALKRESCVLIQIASRLPLPVPRPTYYAPPECPPFTVHDEIVGEMLTRELWENMQTLARDKAADDLAAFLRALHSIPVEIGRSCGLSKMDATELARSLREATANTIHALLDPETRRRLDEILKRWSQPSPAQSQRSVLLHGDIGPGHVLYDPQNGNLTGVIDFGDLAIGDPARDFIYIYEDYGPSLLREVLNRYAGKDAPQMMSAIRKWYLLEAISWTVERFITKQRSEMEHGLAEISRELTDQRNGE